MRSPPYTAPAHTSVSPHLLFRAPLRQALLSLELAVSSAIDHIIFPIVSLGNLESNYFGDWGSQNPQHLLLVVMLGLD